MSIVDPAEPRDQQPAYSAADLVADLAAGGARAAIAADRAGEFLSDGMPDDGPGERAYAEVVDLLRSHLAVVDDPAPAVIRALAQAGPALAAEPLRQLLARCLRSGWGSSGAACLDWLADLGDEELDHELVVRAARSDDREFAAAAVSFLARPVRAA